MVRHGLEALWGHGPISHRQAAGELVLFPHLNEEHTSQCYGLSKAPRSTSIEPRLESLAFDLLLQYSLHQARNKHFWSSPSLTLISTQKTTVSKSRLVTKVMLLRVRAHRSSKGSFLIDFEVNTPIKKEASCYFVLRIRMIVQNEP